jgi:hypothetical protein
VRRILIIVIAAFMTILTANFFSYKSLYSKQINYRTKLLNGQVRNVGLSVDSLDHGFANDLRRVIFSEDIASFFSDPQNRTKTVERMKLFFSKYDDFITGIKLYDSNKNEFTLKKDETGINWLEQTFVLHVQPGILSEELLAGEDRKYEYYLPVRNNEIPVGNIVSVDYQKYLDEIFTVFSFQDYQWHGSYIRKNYYSNFDDNIKFSQFQKILQH